MLSQHDLIAYLENTLPPAERLRVEAALERDPQQRRQLLQNVRLDAALRASLGKPGSHERVKRSVLAVLRGETEEAIKQQVIEDTTFLSSRLRIEAAQASQPFSILHLLRSCLRRRAWAIPLAAACLALCFAVWFALRGATFSPAIETPTLVALSSGAIVPKAGDSVRVNASGSGTVKFADGTILHLEPGTEVRFVSIANPPRAGGKQLKLISGSLTADVAKQPEGRPLLIETPHAIATVVGTEFDLNVATNQTELAVTRGLVKLTGANDAHPVSVAAGEFAVAAPSTATRYGRLARNPYLWPFSSASVWNRPLGSGAQFAPIPGRSFLADGPLENTLRPRPPILGSAGDPLRRIWVNGEVRADIRLSERNLPRPGMRDTIVLLQHARRYALELHGVQVRPDGDLEAVDLERIPLNGPGKIDGSIPAIPFGLSHLGGLLRPGELENGIRHALSARVSRDRLAGGDFAKPLTVWPAAGNPANGAASEKLCVGTLLAIPPDVDLRAVVGDSVPAFELARAMQDYGVYVTGFTDAPFVLLADNARLPEANAWLTSLVPLLQVVINSSPATPGGGGTPRRESAPALPGESE